MNLPNYSSQPIVKVQPQDFAVTDANAPVNPRRSRVLKHTAISGGAIVALFVAITFGTELFAGTGGSASHHDPQPVAARSALTGSKDKQHLRHTCEQVSRYLFDHVTDVSPAGMHEDAEYFKRLDTAYDRDLHRDSIRLQQRFEDASHATRMRLEGHTGASERETTAMASVTREIESIQIDCARKTR